VEGLIRYVWRRWLILVAGVVLGGLLGFLVTAIHQDAYVAQSLVVLTDSQIPSTQFADVARSVFSTDTVLSPVISELAITNQTPRSLISSGALSIVAGLIALAYPGVTAVVLLYVIAFWAIALGIVEVVNSFSTGQVMLLPLGLVGIVFGFLLLANPGAGVLAYVIVLGLFAIVRGIFLLVQAIQQPSIPAASQ
jgi:hypothetical protein